MNFFILEKMPTMPSIPPNRATKSRIGPMLDNKLLHVPEDKEDDALGTVVVGTAGGTRNDALGSACTQSNGIVCSEWIRVMRAHPPAQEYKERYAQRVPHA
jgi:hypothetical protein